MVFKAFLSRGFSEVNVLFHNFPWGKRVKMRSLLLLKKLLFTFSKKLVAREFHLWGRERGGERGWGRFASSPKTFERDLKWCLILFYHISKRLAIERKSVKYVKCYASQHARDHSCLQVIVWTPLFIVVM